MNPTITVQAYPPPPAAPPAPPSASVEPRTVAAQENSAQTNVPASPSIAPPAVAAKSEPASNALTPASDPCKGVGTCYAAENFVAEVTRVTTSRPSAGPVNATIVHRVEVRFRNISTKPVILVHRPDGATMIDNNGNRYWYWNYKVNVTGIGFEGNNYFDPSFIIRPSESRNATFEQRFVYDSRQKVPGNSFTFDLQINEIETPSNQQRRVVRKNAVAFRDLR